MDPENSLQCIRLEQMCIITNNLTVLMVRVKVKLASRNHFPPGNNSYHLIQYLRDTYRPAGHQGRRNSCWHLCQLIERSTPILGFPSKF